MIAALLLVLAAIGEQAQPPGRTQGQTQSQAQPAPFDPSSPTELVTGRRGSRERALRHMTSAMTPVVDAGQPLARFQAPICPQVDGLTAALDKAVADRIRADAGIAGLDVAFPT